jgi:uncharacterized peroxidase-related enzyme
MLSIPALQDDALSSEQVALLQQTQNKLGRVPNMYRVMAHSPAVLEAYQQFAAALTKGSIGAKMMERIALATAEFNQCSYCLSAHSFLGVKAGLQEAETLQARTFHAEDEKTAAALQFAKQLLSDPAGLSPDVLRGLRQKGFTDGEILEVIANVVRNIFTNYVNVIAGTAVDWPLVVNPLNTVEDAAG